MNTTVRTLLGSLAMAGTLALAPADAEAQIFPPYPDAIMCVFAGSGVSSGPRVFYIISQQPAGGQLIYRVPRAAADFDFNFDATTGAYVSKSGVPVATTCDNQSLGQIQAAGAAYFLGGVGGGIPSGAVVQFALASCPAGWTQETVPASTVILCKKN
jgi:hypothetical protein